MKNLCKKITIIFLSVLMMFNFIFPRFVSAAPELSEKAKEIRAWAESKIDNFFYENLQGISTEEQLDFLNMYDKGYYDFTTACNEEEIFTVGEDASSEQHEWGMRIFQYWYVGWDIPEDEKDLKAAIGDDINLISLETYFYQKLDKLIQHLSSQTPTSTQASDTGKIYQIRKYAESKIRNFFTENLAGKSSEEKESFLNSNDIKYFGNACVIIYKDETDSEKRNWCDNIIFWEHDNKIADEIDIDVLRAIEKRNLL